MENVQQHGPVLSVDGVSLSLGGRPVLEDVSFEVQDLVRPGCVTGQVVALLGPSGVGKTQLLGILSGLVPASKGRVLVGPSQQSVRAGTVGVVAQDSPLFQHRTVSGNLAVAARGQGRERIAKVEAILDSFGLRALASRYPCELSGGQRQRVAIAQQVLCSDHLLLLDEPFSGQDPAAIERLLALLRTVVHAHELNTIVLVTHDVRAALSIADAVLLLGRPSPGAPGRIAARYDLVQRGLAFRTDGRSDPAFAALEEEITDRFGEL